LKGNLFTFGNSRQRGPGCVKLLSKKVRFSYLLQQYVYTIMSEALYEADKSLEKFAAALR